MTTAEMFDDPNPTIQVERLSGGGGFVRTSLADEWRAAFLQGQYMRFDRCLSEVFADAYVLMLADQLDFAPSTGLQRGIRFVERTLRVCHGWSTATITAFTAINAMGTLSLFTAFLALVGSSVAIGLYLVLMNWIF